MSTVYRQSGTSYIPSDTSDLVIHNELPTGNYIIQKDPFGNLYFTVVDSFARPKKIYGDTIQDANRILNTFQERTVSTGVLLSGEKGSGKTLLAKMISIQAAELNMPTIVINSAWHDDTFKQLMQNIEQPAIVMFDEFEKVYDHREQESLLTMLDGSFSSKKLFLFTCNDMYRIDQHMKNRPGRIFYNKEFAGLEEAFIKDYCLDNLDDESQVDSVIRLTKFFNTFNFDMLKALIEEMNRYKEDASKASQLLNIRPNASNYESFTIDVLKNGVPIDHHFAPSSWSGQPFTNAFTVNVDPSKQRSRKPTTVHNMDDDDYGYTEEIAADGDESDAGDAKAKTELVLSPDNLQRVDMTTGDFIYTDSGYTVKLSRFRSKSFKWQDAF